MLPGISLAHDLRQALQSGDPKQVAVAIEFATTFNRDVWQHSPSWVAPGWGMSTRREVEAVVQVLKENHLDAPPPENRAGQTYLIEDGYVGTKQQAAAHELGRRLGALTPDNAWVAARGGDLHDMEQADLAGEMFRGLGSGVMPGAGKGDLTRGVAPPDVGPPRTTGEPAWKPPPPPPTETAIYDPATRSWRRPPRGNYEGKATFGEHAVVFRGFSTRNGWAILEGPSGAGGHAYNARGFDGVAFRLEGPFQMRLYDNKALTATTVRSATALVQHLDANLAGLQARVDALNPNDVPRLAEIKETIKNARESLAAGRPLPAEIVLEVTHEGGNSAEISRTLRKAGLVTRTNLDDPDPHLPPVPAPPATALPRPRMAVQPPAPGKAPTRSEPIERPRLGPRQLPGSPPPPERPPTHATLGSPDSGYFPPPFTTPPRFAVPPIAPPAAFQPGPPPQSAGTPGGSPAQTTAAAPSGVPAGPPTAPPASQPPSAALPALPSQPPGGDATPQPQIGPSPAASPPPPAASPPPPAASPPPPPDPPPVYVPPPPPPAPFAGWGQPDPGNTNSPYGTWQESTAAGGPTGQPPPSPPPSDPPPVYVPPPPPPAPFAGWGQPDPGNTNSPYGTWQENVAPAAPPPQPPTPPPQPQPPAPPAQPPPATPTP